MMERRKRGGTPPQLFWNSLRMRRRKKKEEKKLNEEDALNVIRVSLRGHMVKKHLTKLREKFMPGVLVSQKLMRG